MRGTTKAHMITWYSTPIKAPWTSGSGSVPYKCETWVTGEGGAVHINVLGAKGVHVTANVSVLVSVASESPRFLLFFLFGCILS